VPKTINASVQVQHAVYKHIYSDVMISEAAEQKYSPEVNLIKYGYIFD